MNAQCSLQDKLRYAWLIRILIVVIIIVVIIIIVIIIIIIIIIIAHAATRLHSVPLHEA